MSHCWTIRVSGSFVLYCERRSVLDQGGIVLVGARTHTILCIRDLQFNKPCYSGSIVLVCLGFFFPFPRAFSLCSQFTCWRPSPGSALSKVTMLLHPVSFDSWKAPFPMQSAGSDDKCCCGRASCAFLPS